MAFPLLPVLSAVVPPVIGAIKEALTPKPKATLGKDDFLKLLVTQLRHQDPLNPLSNDKFIEQTTAFSNLEQLQGIRQGLDGMVGHTGASAVASGTALLGKTVTATQASFTYAGATVALPFALETPMASGAVEILDSGGAVVARIPLGTREAGAHSVDLTPGSTGRALAAGQYRYRIVSQDLAGRLSVVPAVSGTVTGLRVDNGLPVLTAGGRRIALADVASVGDLTR